MKERLCRSFLKIIMNNCKLRDIYTRYKTLTEKLSDPSVPAGSEEWTKIAKEQSELAETAAKYEEYVAEERKILQAEEALKSEGDAEMRELLNEEIFDCKRRLEGIEEELKILLLPKDPNDDKNIILEIRAGAGGDEAALFAAELYRMYVNYAESHRWIVEIINVNENGIGGFKEVIDMVTGKGACSH